MLAFIVVAGFAFQVRACPEAFAAGAQADSGWQDYRRGAIDAAARHFAAAEGLCAGVHDVQVGLGFVALRRGETVEAERRFRGATQSGSTDADAWYGLGLALVRMQRREDAVMAFRRALALAPHYTDVEQQLLALGDSAAVTPSRGSRPATAAVPARTNGEHFEVWRDSAWTPFYVKGINLGAALPGHFPSEFPEDDSTYDHWIRLIAEAHANTIRLYTIFPPAFYRAFRRWNDAHPEAPVWLIHGVWAEPPPQDNYDDRTWLGGFRAEMRRVVDLVHGRAAIPARRGHAWGRYTVDVSDHVLAFIIGREWEPFTIRAYNGRPTGRTAYAGRFLAVDRGTPAEVWMAEQCDYLLGYEWDAFHAQRPIAYTNWPTLDPLVHPTESTLEEENALRATHGLPPLDQVHEYNNDDQSLDAMVVHPTPRNLGGWFASYHAYPYYPDFMDYDPGYAQARSAFGPSHYFGYLEDLRRHHAGRPVLIAEYGVPSSRGLAHLQPEGMHHGGHDEAAMAAIDARLTREIHEVGLAGGVLFSWLDEWFKHNWVVTDFERPAERNRLWHNPMDAEQNYGLLGQYAGDGRGPVLGGDAARWRTLRTVARGDSVRLRVGSDEAYVYLAIERREAPETARYRIGLDTYRPDRGEFRLPGVTDRLDTGIEFYLDLDPGDTTSGRLLVARHYNPYLIPRPGMGPTGLDRFYNRDARADVVRATGEFDSLFVTTNRFRIGRTGDTFPARGVDRGRLRFGTEAASTLADWYVDRTAGLVEVRLPWGLLNVTDPSSRTVVTAVRGGGVVETDRTTGFRFIVAVGRSGDDTTWHRLPTASWTWPTWEQPRWHQRLKPAYYAMQSVWGEW